MTAGMASDVHSARAVYCSCAGGVQDHGKYVLHCTVVYHAEGFFVGWLNGLEQLALGPPPVPRSDLFSVHSCENSAQQSWSVVLSPAPLCCWTCNGVHSRVPCCSQVVGEVAATISGELTVVQTFTKEICPDTSSSLQYFGDCSKIRQAFFLVP